MSDHRPIESDDPPLDDVALEALAEAYATPPPPALRDRLLAAASAGAAARRAATRWRTLGSLAAATTLVMGGLLASVLRHSGARESELAQVLRVLAGPRTLVATLAPTAGQPASGRVVVDASTGEAALVVVGLDAPGEGKTQDIRALGDPRRPAAGAGRSLRRRPNGGGADAARARSDERYRLCGIDRTVRRVDEPHGTDRSRRAAQELTASAAPPEGTSSRQLAGGVR
jgi:hypothetical protein